MGGLDNNDFFFFSSRRRHTRWNCDWSSDVCSSDLAWTDVWICRDPNGHLQATGRDQRGRKQYRYDPRWREVRDEAKYGKLLIFARVLPLIRARVEADLKRPGLPRERVLAAVVRLMELTLF